MKISRITRRYNKLNSLAFLILFLLAIGLAAWLTHRYSFQQDWTESQRNSLAPVTRNLVRKISQPIHFIAFVSSNSALHKRIQQQISKYQRVNHAVTLKFFDPDLSPKKAQQYGITHAGQLVIKIGKDTRKVNNLGQQNIVNALMQLDRTGNRWIVFLKGQKERSPLNNNHHGLGRLAKTLEQTGLRIQPINLLETPQIPENTAVLVIAGPTKNFTNGESNAIMEYVKSGGNLLWMHNPGSLHGLTPLAKKLNLRFIPGTVVDANPELRAMIGIHNPAVVPILNYGNSRITSHLKIQTLMPFSAAIAQPAGGGSWQAEPLLRTLPKSWSETGPLKGHVKYNAASGDTLGPLILGEAFSRKLTGNHLQRIAVFGSSAFASNAFIGMGANLNLMTATINWLSHNDNLIHIDLPSAPDTKLALSRADGYAIGAFFLILLPLSLLLAGILIWYRRRRTTS